MEDLKNRRSKIIVVEWINEMEWFEVWNRDVFYAIIKSVRALTDEYDYEIRTINGSANLRSRTIPKLVSA